MSRLDRQINTVRNTLAMAVFLQAWARAQFIAADVALAYLIVRAFTAWRLPHEWAMAGGLIGLTVVWGFFVAARRRPDAMTAAAAIDGRLSLNEKYSTALHARASSDPFAKAAVLDAEQSAGAVDLRGKFKLRMPKLVLPAALVAIIAGGVGQFIEPRNVFASNTPKPGQSKPVTNTEREKAKIEIEKAIAKIDAMPKVTTDTAAVRMAKAELQDLLKKPDLNPDAGKRKALSALQDLEKAAQQAQKTQQFADAKQNEQMLSKLSPDSLESGAVAEAQRALAKGDFDSPSKARRDGREV